MILASESYGGRYLPAWYDAMTDYNGRASVENRLTVTGILVGNAFVDEAVQGYSGYSFIEFAKRQGLIPPHSTPISSKQTREIMSKYLGYQPNYYDYRRQEKECCGCSSYNYKPWGDWLLREDVAQALNVCGDAGIKAFGGCAAGCISLADFDKDSNFDYKGMLAKALDDGVKVTLYYGMQDTACNYVGGYALAASLRWKGAAEFKRSSFEDLTIGGMEIGMLKTGGGLSYLQVEAAGHMVSISNPAAASFALGTLLPAQPGESCLQDSASLQLKSAVPPLRHLLSAGGEPSTTAGLAAFGVLGALAGAVLALRREARRSKDHEHDLILLD